MYMHACMPHTLKKRLFLYIHTPVSIAIYMRVSGSLMTVLQMLYDYNICKSPVISNISHLTTQGTMYIKYMQVLRALKLQYHDVGQYRCYSTYVTVM